MSLFTEFIGWLRRRKEKKARESVPQEAPAEGLAGQAILQPEFNVQVTPPGNEVNERSSKLKKYRPPSGSNKEPSMPLTGDVSRPPASGSTNVHATLFRNAQKFNVEKIDVITAGGDITQITNIATSAAGAGVGGNMLDEKLPKVLAWLTSTNHRRYHGEVVARRAPETGRWFLESEELRWWLEKDKAVFWVTGMPGAGKTILASTAIDYLGEQSDALAYAYCRYDDEYTATDLLLCMVRQVLEDNPENVFPAVEPTFDSHSLKDEALLTKDAARLLGSVLGKLPRMRIVLDGLDEIADGEKCALLEVLTALPIQLLIFSRPLPLFEHMLGSRPLKLLNIEARNEDVRAFITATLKGDPALRMIIGTEESTIKEVTTLVQKQSSGMFLVAKLQVEALKECSNLASLKATVRTLPSGPNGMYDRTMHRIEGQGKDKALTAKHALLWVARSCRPLSIEELLDALATQYHQGSFEFASYDPEAKTPKDVLMSLCCGLLVVGQSGVRFIHYTAQDYIRRLEESTLPFSAFSEITLMTCMSHILYHQGQDNEVFTLLQDDLDTKNRTFLTYSAAHWGIHAQRYVSDKLDEATMMFLLMRGQEYLSDKVGGTWKRVHTLSPCHVVVLFGLSRLLPQMAHLHQPDPASKCNALHVALQTGDQATVQALLQMPMGVPHLDINAESGGVIPLIHAVKERDVALIRLLFGYAGEPPLDPNVVTAQGENALTLASRNGFGDVVTALLQYRPHRGPSVDLNTLDRDGWTPLLLAAREGYAEVVKALLDYEGQGSLDINATTKGGRTALMIASWRGHTEVVKAFTQDSGRSVDVNARDEHSLTALLYAAREGHTDVVEALLARRSNPALDVEARAEGGLTALMLASLHGHVKVVKALLDYPGTPPVRVSAVSDDGWTALMYACWEGRIRVVEALLAHPHAFMAEGGPPEDTRGACLDMAFQRLRTSAGFNDELRYLDRQNLAKLLYPAINAAGGRLPLPTPAAFHPDPARVPDAC